MFQKKLKIIKNLITIGCFIILFNCSNNNDVTVCSIEGTWWDSDFDTTHTVNTSKWSSNSSNGFTENTILNISNTEKFLVYEGVFPGTTTIAYYKVQWILNSCDVLSFCTINGANPSTSLTNAIQYMSLDINTSDLSNGCGGFPWTTAHRIK